MQDATLIQPPMTAATAPQGRVLAVEDDATSLAILAGLLEEMGYEVLEAENGREAVEIVDRQAVEIDVIVLDKSMPEMDGMEVVAQLKADVRSRHIPAIMVTGSTRPDEVKEGIDAGVFYYLTKPFEDEIFKSVLSAAMREAQRRNTLKSELQKHHTSFNFLEKAEFRIRKLEDAEDLACFIANCFPNPEIALQGLAGLLINAVEHGSLEIGYQAKTGLLRDGRWREEVENRAELPQFRDRAVHVRLERNDKEIKVVIADEGPGFNWNDFLEIDPSRALDNHGRGIAQANKISFDSLTYNDKGNEVTAVSRLESGIKW